MARGVLNYINYNDGFTKKIDKTGENALTLLDNLKLDFSNLFFNDMACGHGASIKVFDGGDLVFNYVFNNGSWRVKNNVSNGNYTIFDRG